MVFRLTGLFVLLAIVVCGCQTNPTTFAPPPSFHSPKVVARPSGSVPAPVTVRPKSPTVATAAPQPVPAVPGSMLTSESLKPRAPLRDWQYIVIHHSASPAGCAATFDRAHRERGWDMLGYDFVIGNGTQSADGVIEVGPRWTRQMRGAHTGTPDQKYNDHGIGVCLVGDFENSRPTAAQYDSLTRLCAHLMSTYNIPASHILGHRDCKSTQCPGRNLDVGQIRTLARSYVESGR